MQFFLRAVLRVQKRCVLVSLISFVLWQTVEATMETTESRDAAVNLCRQKSLISKTQERETTKTHDNEKDKLGLRTESKQCG